ncbi:MAG: FtsX-like permease family protein [Candidatus Bathyarchaeia archaeon]
MNVLEIFSFSLNALRERKVRAALTILMVVIGASLIISLDGMSAGMNVFIEEQFSVLAPNIIIVTPAPVIMGAGGAQSNPVELNALTVNTLRSIPGVLDVSPIIARNVELRSGGSTISVMMVGMDQTKAHYIAPNIKLEEGQLVSPFDSVGVVVGHDIKYPPGQTQPFARLGQSLTAQYTVLEGSGSTQKPVTVKRSFIVRGSIEDLGASSFIQMNDIALVSLSAAQTFFKTGGEYDAVYIVTRSADLNPQVEERIREIYGEDIGITTPKAIVETIQGFVSGFSVFVSAIAAISMIVAAVGVVTTLLTAVMERTREIGILKALGFKDSLIMLLFLSEAALIGAIGASVGILLGMGLGASLLSMLLAGTPQQGFFGEIKPVFFAGDILFVWGFALITSIIAGFYPAWRASSLDPIVALRRE